MKSFYTWTWREILKCSNYVKNENCLFTCLKRAKYSLFWIFIFLIFYNYIAKLIFFFIFYFITLSQIFSSIHFISLCSILAYKKTYKLKSLNSFFVTTFIVRIFFQNSFVFAYRKQRAPYANDGTLKTWRIHFRKQNLNVIFLLPSFCLHSARDGIHWPDNW